MSTQASNVRRVFQEAFGEGRPTVPRQLGDRQGVTVRLRGHHVILTVDRLRGIIESPKQTGGEEPDPGV